jgi:putative intracellular protease/amidase
MTKISEDQKQVLIPIACGSCEAEIIMIATTLQMFDVVVVLASVVEEDRNCAMIGGFMMRADINIQDALCFDWDLIVIPGGGKHFGFVALLKKDPKLSVNSFFNFILVHNCLQNEVL